MKAVKLLRPVAGLVEQAASAISKKQSDRAEARRFMPAIMDRHTGCGKPSVRYSCSVFLLVADPGFVERRHAGMASGGGFDDGDRQRRTRCFTKPHVQV